MPVMTKNIIGSFCWSELATSDPEGAKKFYSEIFGWGYHDDQIPGAGVYTMLLQGDARVGAMFAINEEMKAANVPPHWLNYIAVDSVDETAARAQELGAAMPRPPMDVMDLGRMAVLADPTGAHFALWQAKKVETKTLVNEPVSPVWQELVTNDIEKAGSFYTNLFNWGSSIMPMPSGDYTMFKNGDRTAAGMMAMTPEMPDMPPAWVVYFAVDSADETAKKAEAAGAKILQPPTPVEGMGRMAAFLDPQGAGLAVFQMSGPPEALPE